MKLRNLRTGGLVGGLLTAPLIGLMYLADKWAGLAFPPFDLFDGIARVLPGPVITFGIDLMIDVLVWLGMSVADTARTAEQVIALSQFLLLGVVAGAIAFAPIKVRNITVGTNYGLMIGALYGLPMVAVSIAMSQSKVDPTLNVLWLGGLFLVWGLALGQTSRRLAPEAPEATAQGGEVRSVEVIDRRQFLIRLGATTATITIIGSSLGRIREIDLRRQLEAELAAARALQSGGSVLTQLPNAGDPVVPAPGTRPEYTAVKDHYKVSIRLGPTKIDGATWMLPFTGLVDNPLMLTLDDIQNNYVSRDQYVTISCISGQIATDLISTTRWTGVSLQEVLADAEVRSDARYLFITSGDGFYETVDLDLIASDERIMLCYAWDGNPIPADHGFPLRIWIPDLYGMKQPKWITGIEVIGEYKEGFWVERGWDRIAQVKAVSVVDTVAVKSIVEDGAQRLVPIGGIAFAGARGISKVEVRVDGRGPWHEARLRSPLSETTWVIWRYDWPFEAGRHVFEVRCAEGDGTPQIQEPGPNRPHGATGIHSRVASL